MPMLLLFALTAFGNLSFSGFFVSFVFRYISLLSQSVFISAKIWQLLRMVNIYETLIDLSEKKNENFFNSVHGVSLFRLFGFIVSVNNLNGIREIQLKPPGISTTTFFWLFFRLPKFLIANNTIRLLALLLWFSVIINWFRWFASTCASNSNLSCWFLYVWFFLLIVRLS